MRTLSVAVAALAVAALAVAGVLGTGAVAGAKGSTTIKLLSESFSPDEKSISAGTKVKFNWVEGKHNVVKAKGPGADFASGTTATPGVNFTKKFSKAGSYKLICTVHEQMKLKLKVS
jgi:plastocyanin